MADFTFFYCGVCGAMSVVNFRDDCCKVCRTAMSCTMVRLYFDEPDHVDVREAPHTEPDED